MIYKILLVALVLSSGIVSGQSLDTLRHLNVKPGGGYAAIWGYTAPNGREYALLGCNGSSGQQAGTSFIDITNIGNVHQVGFVPGPPSSWREMKTYRQYAYIVTEASGSGTQIVDLSYLPDSVHLVSTFVYTQSTKNTAKSHSVTIADGFLYLNGCANWGTQFQRGTVIFDLRADPTNPVFVGEYSPSYFHDTYVLRDTIYGSAIYSGGGLYIADARNKSSIVPIGQITYTGSGTHNAWVTKDRRYVITTDEIGSTAKTLKVWDIQNLPTIPPLPTATFTPSPTDIEHNITIRGDYAYVAWYTRGAVVVNITNPASPVLAGSYDTSTQPSGGYEGMWGIYPYFPSGKVVGGDMQNGLWVFSFSDLAPRVPVTLLQPVMNETTATGNPVSFRWTKSANLSKDPHWYDVRLTGPALDTTWRANDSVAVFSALGNLQAGSQYTWYVTTRDEFNTTQSPQSFQFIYGVASPAASVTVTAPNGGENWQNTTLQNIQWSSLNLSGNVKVELSRNGGSSYETLYASTANDGTEVWTVTGPVTSSARIRVSSVSTPAVRDSSNGVFNISPGFSLLTKMYLRDNGGELDSLEYGTGMSATDGIDASFGEFELPPLPPTGVLDVRWQIAGTLGTERDIRDTLGGTHQQVIYTGKLQAGGGGYPFVLKWNRLELPAGTFTLRDGPAGAFFLVNMKQQDSLVISDDQIPQFQIVYDAGNVVASTAQSGWNILSVPVNVADRRKTVVFPTSTSNAFAYTPIGYVNDDTLDYGVGYWLKFPSTQLLSLTGGTITSDTIDVIQGWNIIGSISTSVPVGSIIQIPGGIVASSYIGYGITGYGSATSIDPMRGYWVKVNQNGKLVLPGSVLKEVRTSKRK